VRIATLYDMHGDLPALDAGLAEPVRPIGCEQAPAFFDDLARAGAAR
jgi:hypothetical protein